MAAPALRDRTGEAASPSRLCNPPSPSTPSAAGRKDRDGSGLKDKGKRRLTGDMASTSATGGSSTNLHGTLAAGGSGGETPEVLQLSGALERAVAAGSGRSSGTAVDVSTTRAALVVLERLVPGSARLLLDQLLGSVGAAGGSGLARPASPAPHLRSHPQPQSQPQHSQMLLARWRRSCSLPPAPPP